MFIDLSWIREYSRTFLNFNLQIRFGSMGSCLFRSIIVLILTFIAWSYLSKYAKPAKESVERTKGKYEIIKRIISR